MSRGSATTLETGLAQGKLCVHRSVVLSWARMTCSGIASADTVGRSVTLRVHPRGAQAQVQAGACPNLSVWFLLFSLRPAIPPPCPSLPQAGGIVTWSSIGWHLTNHR